MTLDFVETYATRNGIYLALLSEYSQDFGNLWNFFRYLQQSLSMLALAISNRVGAALAEWS